MRDRPQIVLRQTRADGALDVPAVQAAVGNRAVTCPIGTRMGDFKLATAIRARVLGPFQPLIKTRDT